MSQKTLHFILSLLQIKNYTKRSDLRSVVEDYATISPFALSKAMSLICGTALFKNKDYSCSLGVWRRHNFLPS
jgi:hypothetical protein